MAMLWAVLLLPATTGGAALGAAELPTDEAVAPEAVLPSDADPAENATGDSEGSEEPDVRRREGLFGPAPRLGPWRISGAFDQRYRLRDGADSRDQDLHGYLNLQGTFQGAENEEDDRGPDWNIDAAYSVDVDEFESRTPPSSFLPFVGATDGFGRRFYGTLHSAWIEWRDRAWFDHLRLGRQRLEVEEGILFDGAWWASPRMGILQLHARGGVPAHLWETSPRGDALGSLGAEAFLTRDLTFGLVAVYLRDERKEIPDAEDYLTILRANYRLTREWRLRAEASWDGADERRQSVEARWASQESGWTASLRARRQSSIVDFQATDISPFLVIEGSYAPYYQIDLDTHRPFGEHLGLGLGLRARALEDSSDAGVFNHSFRNYWVAIDFARLWPGMEAVVRGDAWDADGEDIFEVGFDLSQDITDRLEVSAGTSYALYRVDLLTGQERERDRLYQVRLRYDILDGAQLDARYRYERDSFSEYHTLTLGVRIWF